MPSTEPNASMRSGAIYVQGQHVLRRKADYEEKKKQWEQAEMG